MKTSEELKILSDEELVTYSKITTAIGKKRISTLQKELNIPNGVLNSYGKGKEYLSADLKKYYSSYTLIINEWVIPIESEIKNRVIFSSERLKFFENNIKNAYVGRVSKAHANPHWYTHLKKIARFYKQDDYQTKLKIEERNNNIKNILENG